MSIFDLGIWCGKTFPEPLAVTKERTSEQCLKKQQKSSVKMPLFLDLRTENGHQAAALWVMGGPLLGEYMMRSFGECPKEEKESLLSQILEETPLPKYSLSAKACQGILRRAAKRGKKLPELLERTLIRQSACKEMESTEQTQQDVTAKDGVGGVLHTQHNRQTSCPRSAFKNEPGNPGGAKEYSYNMSEQEHCLPSTINPSYGVITKGNGDAFINPEVHTTLSVGGGQAG
jgi:hypothetical protein